jgi:AraC family ethanolamine operon transcriptional activator
MPYDSHVSGRSTWSNGPFNISRLPESLLLHEAQPEVTTRVVRGFDADQLRESFRPGEINHRLLEAGPFDAHLLRVSTAKLVLTLFRYSLPVALTGTWPQGCLGLLFGLEIPDGAVAHGHPFPTGAIAVLDRSTGMDFRLSAHATCAIVIVDRESFESTVSSCDPGTNYYRAVDGIPLCVREPETRRLKGLLRAVLDDAELAAHLLRTPGSSLVLERDILRSYAKALVTAETLYREGVSVLHRRHRLVKKAVEFVIERLDQSIHMETLCREVGASPRALEYAFHAIYGMGAMRYLRTIRLNEVRNALLHAGGSNRATVTSIAMDWGFWHLGEFAAAYRRLFGEPPSETLRTAEARYGGTDGAPVRETAEIGQSTKASPAARTSLCS